MVNEAITFPSPLGTDTDQPAQRHDPGPAGHGKGATMTVSIDVPAWIEAQPVGRTQILVATLMGLTAALDGFDAQMIGYVAPR
jgi:hypothetical protein